MFSGHSKPQKSEWFGTPENFQPIRDGLETQVFYVDVDLSTARTVNNPLALDFSGNSFYIDANPADGVATAQFQHRDAGNSGAPFYVFPGFSINIAFTRVLFTNAAQAGKKIRVFYGVDVDFAQFSPGQPATVTFPNAFQTWQQYYGTLGNVYGATISTISIAAAGTAGLYIRAASGSNGIDVTEFQIKATNTAGLVDARCRFAVALSSITTLGGVLQTLNGAKYGSGVAAESVNQLGAVGSVVLGGGKPYQKDMQMNFQNGYDFCANGPIYLGPGQTMVAFLTNNGAAAASVGFWGTWVER